VFSSLMLNTWIAASIVAVIAGITGFFAVLRGQTFTAHAIPNGAFAGAAGASLLGINVIWGLLVFAVGGALGIGLLGGEGRGPTDHLEVTVTAIETQQDGSDSFTALVDAVSDGHAVSVAMMLDLNHLPFPREIRPLKSFGDHPIQTGTLELPQPLCPESGILGGAGDVAPVPLVDRVDQRFPTHPERFVHQ